jgi:hypothetical protein
MSFPLRKGGSGRGALSRALVGSRVRDQSFDRLMESWLFDDAIARRRGLSARGAAFAGR